MDQTGKEVIVVDIKMRFWSMVFFMVKWAIASIPAFIILAVLLSIFAAMFQGCMGRWGATTFRM